MSSIFGCNCFETLVKILHSKVINSCNPLRSEYILKFGDFIELSKALEFYLAVACCITWSL